MNELAMDVDHDDAASCATIYHAKLQNRRTTSSWLFVQLLILQEKSFNPKMRKMFFIPLVLSVMILFNFSLSTIRSASTKSSLVLNSLSIKTPDSSIPISSSRLRSPSTGWGGQESTLNLVEGSRSHTRLLIISDLGREDFGIR